MKRPVGLLLISLLMAGCAGLQPRPIFRVPEKQESTPAEPPAEKETAEPTREKYSSSRSERLFIREKLMQQIEGLLGVPYQFGGTSRNGMDCSGLVYYVYKNALGMELPRQVEELYRFANPIPEDRLDMGDLVFFRFSGTKRVDHVGIYLSDGRFVHASRTRGVIISSIRSSYYRDHFVGARRVLVR